MALPVGEAAEAPLKVTDVLLTPEAMVAFTIATVPFAIRLLFIPVARHVYAPEEAEQVRVLPAFVAAGPATAEIEVMVVGAYFSVH